MKLGLIVAVLFSCLSITLCSKQNGDSDLKFEVVGSDLNLRTLIRRSLEDDTEMSGSGDDETSGSGSGSGDTDDTEEGSGEVIPTTRSTLVVDPVDKSTKAPTRKQTTSKPTESNVVVINDVSTSKKPSVEVTTDKSLTTKEDEVIIVTPGDGAAKAQDGEKEVDDEEEKGGVNFTIGIIIGVVVGAILAILIILLLVYRLRKKDEGSYILDENSSQTFLRGDEDSKTAGKEYFA